MAGVGSQLSQPPLALLNTANAVTRKYYHPRMIDQYGRPSPTYWRLIKRSRRFDGGGSIVYPLAFQEEVAGGAYWGAQLLSVLNEDSVQPAELQWKSYYQSITVPVLDVLLNEGAGRAIDLVTIKQEQAMVSILQKLCRALYGVAPQNTSIDFDSVAAALAAAGGSYAQVTLGGANSWWLCNGGVGPVTMAAAPGSTGAAINLAGIQGAFGQATFGNEEPDTIITTQAGYNLFLGLLIGNQRYAQDAEITGAGFRHVLFNGAPVLHDQFVPAGQMVMLNTKYVFLFFHRNDYFTRDPWIQPTDQRVIVSHIYVTGNLVFLSLRQHSLITTITGA